jgi:hypothetical protein
MEEIMVPSVLDAANNFPSSLDGRNHFSIRPGCSKPFLVRVTTE